MPQEYPHTPDADGGVVYPTCGTPVHPAGPALPKALGTTLGLPSALH